MAGRTFVDWCGDVLIRPFLCSGEIEGYFCDRMNLYLTNDTCCLSEFIASYVSFSRITLFHCRAQLGQLDCEQQKIVKHMMQDFAKSPDGAVPLIVYGPFGTGKTRTLAVAILELLRQKRSRRNLRVLICTQSNRFVIERKLRYTRDNSYVPIRFLRSPAL